MTGTRIDSLNDHVKTVREVEQKAALLMRIKAIMERLKKMT